MGRGASCCRRCAAQSPQRRRGVQAPLRDQKPEMGGQWAILSGFGVRGSGFGVRGAYRLWLLRASRVQGLRGFQASGFPVVWAGAFGFGWRAKGFLTLKCEALCAFRFALNL